MFFRKQKRIETHEVTIKELMDKLEQLRKEYETEIFQHAFYAGKLEAYKEVGVINSSIEEISISDLVNDSKTK